MVKNVTVKVSAPQTKMEVLLPQIRIMKCEAMKLERLWISISVIGFLKRMASMHSGNGMKTMIKNGNVTYVTFQKISQSCTMRKNSI